jgi:outer membrane protein OmpA-like peptidoglycan-associated protein
MKSVIELFACLFTMVLLSSCAEKNVFVLLPGADGKTGKIVVSNSAGTQELTEPNQATAVASANELPAAPYPMSDERIKERFGAALAALPLPPQHFILYFKSGTTELTGESRKLLQEVISAALSRHPADISVVGHTDRVGSRDANFRLGLERTGIVRDMLVSRGIDPEFIDVSSHGEDNPLVQTDDNVAEQRNRRVEVDVR